MAGQPWNELLEAVKVFVDDQISTCNRSGITPEHLVTIINHASSAEKTCDSIPIQNLDVSVHTRFRSGGNCFKTALETVYSEMMKVLEGYSLVLLFMSDGGCGNGEHEIQMIARDFAGKNLQIFFVGFGAGCDEKKLKNMAVISGGQYVFGANGVDLKQGFMKISEEISTKTYTR